MLLLLVLCCGVIFAQKTVTGTVTDELGVPIPNASIQVKGMSVGTISKEDGTFSINIPENAKTLVVSGIGKAPQEVTIGNRLTFTIVLKDADSSLDEVVVIGYGVQNRKEVTGNIAQVKGAVVADKPVQSFDAALAGRAAGVQITVPNGVLNNPPVFRIRGTNSINLSSQPLIVIDGIVAFTGDVSGTNAASNALSNINPADIENIDILKDAAATAIYGSRAANGVVVITTKKGKKGRAKLTYDGWLGLTSPTRMWEMLDAEEYMMIKNEGTTNAGLADRYLPSYDADGKLINTNWGDILYRDGTSHNHNLSVSGANDMTSYYFSVGYTEQEGIVVGNNFDRKTVRFNADHKATNWLTFGVNSSYTNEVNYSTVNSGSLPGQAFASAGAGRLALALPPNISPYNNDGSYNLNGNAIGRGANIENITFWNPVPIMDHNYGNTENNRVIGNFYVMVKPTKDITFRSTYGIDYRLTDNKSFNTAIIGDGFSTNGSATSTLSKNKRRTWTNTLQYDKTFADLHSISLLLGTEQQKTVSEGFGLTRQQLSDQFFTVIQGGFATPLTAGLSLGENFLASYFGRLNYDYDKKYFLAGSLRRDGYSAFAPGLKWGNFYSVSAGWDIAKENFFQGGIGDVVNSLKLRASYGTVGNISGIGNFASFNFYSGTGLYNGNPTLVFSQAGNNLLTWETSKKLDFGFTFGLFNDKITGELAWYKNDVDGLLLNVPNAPSTGLPNSVLQNVGAMWNKGFEFTLNTSPVVTKDFNWNLSFNFTLNNNEVTRLAPGVENIPVETQLEVASIIAPGYPIGMLYVVETRGVDANTGRRIMVNHEGRELLYDHAAPAGQKYTFRDNGQVAPNLNTALAQKIWKSPLPKYFGGLDNTFKYKNIDLNVMLTYQLGFYVYNGTRATTLDQRFWNSNKEVLNRWQKPGDQTDIPRLVYADNTSNGSAFPISDNVEKGDFLRVRNLSLGYSVPNSLLSKFKIANARVYVSGQNMFLFTGYRGPDPEVSTNGTGNGNQGIDRNTVGNAKIITFGLNVGF